MGKQPFHHPLPKVDQQMFDGNNPKSWIHKCHKYFELYHVPEYQKLELIIMYLDSKDKVWF